MHQIQFLLGLRRSPAGELTALRQTTQLDLRGLRLRGGGWKVRVGKGREMEEKTGKGGKRKRKGAREGGWSPIFAVWLRPCIPNSKFFLKAYQITHFFQSVYRRKGNIK